VRILVLAPQEYYVDRGTPIAVDLLVRTLADQGHQVDLLCLHLGAPRQHPNVTVHRTPRVPLVGAVGPGLSAGKLACDAVFAAAAFRLLARRRYDVVHAVEEAVFVAAAARAIFGVPYVYDMDSSMSHQVVTKLPALRPLGRLMRAIEARAIRGSTAVAPVCDALARTAESAGARRIVLLRDVSLLQPAHPNAPDVATLRAEAGAAEPGTVLAMYVGNLERYQGVDLLLDAFARAVADAPRLRLAVVGGAPADVARYARKVEAAGLGGLVRLLGPRPVAQLGEYLAAADVLVSPRTHGENTPMKIYSYMDSGRAVLATDLPTHTQVLDAEVARLVAPEAAAMAAALVALADDPGARAALGNAARRRASARHSRSAFAAQVAALYAPAVPLAPAEAAA
jgi:glycosyltransferase involved in cell wall biosynthesis